ncbi:ribonuclease H protein, partial [Trifolium medium]|nr:ribonuclease H protein [Trifolium medium]
YENRYMEETKLKSSEKVKSQIVMKPLEVELTSNQDVKEVNTETKTSNSSRKQDLDAFLLGDTGSSDDEPALKFNRMRWNSCGGVICGSEGEWLDGFAKRIGNCNTYIVELWDILEGLRFAKDRGFTLVELEVDSEAIICSIQSKGNVNVMGWRLVQRIRQLLQLEWEVKVKHVYCDANACAYALANMG